MPTSAAGRKPAQPPPVLVVEQPDGALYVASDSARVPQYTERAQGVQDGGDPGEARRALAAALRHTLKQRRVVFLCLLFGDFVIFASILVSKVAATRGAARPGAALQPPPPAPPPPPPLAPGAPVRGFDTNISVTWWLVPGDLKLEDVVFSLVLDLLGAVGAVHERSAILGLFILLEALCTALITLSGISLFHIYRIALLGTALYLRSSVLTVLALEDSPSPAQLPPGWRGRAALILGPFTGRRWRRGAARGAGDTGDRSAAAAAAGGAAAGTAAAAGAATGQGQAATGAGAAAAAAVAAEEGAVPTLWPAAAAREAEMAARRPAPPPSAAADTLQQGIGAATPDGSGWWRTASWRHGIAEATDGAAAGPSSSRRSGGGGGGAGVADAFRAPSAGPPMAEVLVIGSADSSAHGPEPAATRRPGGGGAPADAPAAAARPQS